MKRFRLVIVILLAMAIAGIFAFLAARLESKRIVSIPILMYHDIGNATNSPWCVPPETFRAQISALRSQGYKTILPSDLVAHRKWGKPLPRKPIILTFDDGYQSALTKAEPELRKNGFRGIVYLITSTISETPESRRTYEGKPCLTWPEVLAMQQSGTLVFGGHSHKHVNLAGTPDSAGQVEECKKQLRLHGIGKPYSFCYPHGQYNRTVEQAVQRAGFQTAMVCEDAFALIGPTNDLFALPRVSVMGGRHDFRLVSGDFDAKKRTLSCRILHSGIPLEISACLELGGQGATFRTPQQSGAATCSTYSRGTPLPRAERTNHPDRSCAHQGGRRAPRDGFEATSNCLRIPPREIGDGEFDLLFSLPANTSRDELARLEIWDKNRLFKLATFSQ